MRFALKLMQDFKKLDVWKEAMDLCKLVFSLVKSIDDKALSEQLSKSAISIPSNIAEGAGKASQKAFYNHLNIAYASACELQTQIILGGFLMGGQVDPEEEQVVRVQKMLFALMSRIKQKHLTKY